MKGEPIRYDLVEVGSREGELEPLAADVEFTSEDVAALATELAKDIRAFLAKSSPQQVEAKLDSVIAKAIQKRKNTVKELLGRQYASAMADARQDLAVRLERTDALVLRAQRTQTQTQANVIGMLLQAPPIPTVDDIDRMMGDGSFDVWLRKLQLWWGKAVEDAKVNK